jgi:hypothetical protein
MPVRVLGASVVWVALTCFASEIEASILVVEECYQIRVALLSYNV